jgi:serine/threonine-protein kinase
MRGQDGGNYPLAISFFMGIADKFKSLFKPSKIDVSTRFEILKEAISGTMSKFYKARDRETDQIVGLKVCDLEKTNFFENRFTGLNKPDEGVVAMSFDHPLSVKTLEHGVTTDKEKYILMEFLDGYGMNSLIKQKVKGLSGKRLNLIRDMAAAIDVVHEAGYIHRDICPRNFICEKDASGLKLIDFGLTVPATKEFMQPGNRTGTPNYMAPEIVRRKATDKRLDIFAFGVTAFQLLTYQLPWNTGEVSGKAALNHDTKPPTDIFELYPNLHPDIGNTVMNCIAVKPDERPDSLAKVVKMLQKAETDEV